MINTPKGAKREKAYNLFINIIEEYNTKLLSTKIYWTSRN